MSSLEPRRGSRVSRSQKEQRAYRLVVVGSVSAAVAVVGFVLAIAGVIGSGIPVLAAIIAAISAFMFRRVVGSSTS
jgi:putative flippase GtrA